MKTLFRRATIGALVAVNVLLLALPGPARADDPPRGRCSLCFNGPLEAVHCCVQCVTGPFCGTCTYAYQCVGGET